MKQQYTKYGWLPEKKSNNQPWEILCIDLIGPYHILQGTGSNKTAVFLYCATMIDPATGWFEIKETTTRSSDVVANTVEQMWLTRYPWPQKVILDRGMEFMKDVITLVWDEYGIKCKPIATRIPQANSIVDRDHQNIGNLLHMFEPGSAELDPEDPWSSIPSTIMFALRSMVHTIYKANPMQLVFGRDAMLNITHLANWWFIQECWQILIKKNNEQENVNWNLHKYHVNDKVMIKNDQKL
eukprot:10545385-Ditylum_brightwellii.AAC.1